MMFELRALYATGNLRHGLAIVRTSPHAHIADRTGALYCPDRPRHDRHDVSGSAALFEHIVEARPTDFTGVPRVWEKLKAGIEAKIAAGPAGAARRDRGRDRRAGLARVRAEQAGQPVPEALAAGVARAEQLVFAPLREAVGSSGPGRSWSAPRRRRARCSSSSTRSTSRSPRSGGCPSCRAWRRRCRRGARGSARWARRCRAIEIRIADDGEVLVRGPLVMRGYRNRPAQTRETIDDGAGSPRATSASSTAMEFLRIVDRKKEMIINAAGKNMSPANIEARIKTSSALIGQACVIGDGRPYNVALLVLDPDGAMAFCRARGIDLPRDRLVEHEAVRARDRSRDRGGERASVARGADQAVRAVARRVAPGRRRADVHDEAPAQPIAAKYADRIAALYGG